MLAAAAAAAIGADLVGVDLLPLPGGGYTVIELNGAVEFDEDYSLPGGDVYRDAAAALGVLPRRARDAGRPGVQPLVRPGQAETTLVTTLARPLHFPESLARP
jgi:hypothetical protein